MGDAVGQVHVYGKAIGVVSGGNARRRAAGNLQRPRIARRSVPGIGLIAAERYRGVTGCIGQIICDQLTVGAVLARPIADRSGVSSGVAGGALREYDLRQPE